ncbi:chemotaxis regulatory protein ChePep-like [Centruroides vittatus]|uniref:chemotaxis regulatory protein ChePep-like n=1 Tax=Centruroides vittatus TaxID=120091 RepID=UPI00350EA9AB
MSSRFRTTCSFLENESRITRATWSLAFLLLLIITWINAIFAHKLGSILTVAYTTVQTVHRTRRTSSAVDPVHRKILTYWMVFSLFVFLEGGSRLKFLLSRVPLYSFLKYSLLMWCYSDPSETFAYYIRKLLFIPLYEFLNDRKEVSKLANTEDTEDESRDRPLQSTETETSEERSSTEAKATFDNDEVDKSNESEEVKTDEEEIESKEMEAESEELPREISERFMSQEEVVPSEEKVGSKDESEKSEQVVVSQEEMRPSVREIHVQVASKDESVSSEQQVILQEEFVTPKEYITEENEIEASEGHATPQREIEEPGVHVISPDEEDIKLTVPEFKKASTEEANFQEAVLIKHILVEEKEAEDD